MEKMRKLLSEYGKKLVEQGLVAGPGGNISARDGDNVFLSPSGFFLDEIKDEEWVKINLKTGKITGDLRPTCETTMHLGIYMERDEVRAVIHTHPPVTVGLISAGVKFKPLFPDYVALLGREVPVVDYVQPGGEAIRKAVVAKIKKCNVVLLKNHGAVCIGETLKEAYARSVLMEETAKTVFVGKVAGHLKCLSLREVEEVENMEAEDYRNALLKKSL